MPALIDAVQAYATEGEIVAALGEVFGTYTETSDVCDRRRRSGSSSPSSVSTATTAGSRSSPACCATRASR